MSYMTWRKNNEDKTLEIVNDGKLENLPAWEVAATSILTDTVITPVVDDILKKPGMVPLAFPCVFGEYLYEEYNVSSADVEILAQVMLRGVLGYVTKEVEETVAAVVSTYKMQVRNTLQDSMEKRMRDSLENIIHCIPDEIREDVRDSVESYIQGMKELNEEE